MPQVAGTVRRRTALAAARETIARDPSATMHDLATAAGVSYGTLYRMFGSRDAILRELDQTAPAPARERILAAAASLVDRREMSRARMDDVAEAAGVSRATLYRLFPGKAPLLRELARIHSPWEGVPKMLATMPGPPEEVIPVLARAMLARMSERTGLMLTIGLDLLRQDARSPGESERSMAQGLSHLVRYLRQQMAVGRLREGDPIIALLLLVGPIIAHAITRRLPLGGSSISMPADDCVDEIVQTWLRAMAPDRRPDAGSVGR